MSDGRRRGLRLAGWRGRSATAPDAMTATAPNQLQEGAAGEVHPKAPLQIRQPRIPASPHQNNSPKRRLGRRRRCHCPIAKLTAPATVTHAASCQWHVKWMANTETDHECGNQRGAHRRAGRIRARATNASHPSSMPVRTGGPYDEAEKNSRPSGGTSGNTNRISTAAKRAGTKSCQGTGQSSRSISKAVRSVLRRMRCNVCVAEITDRGGRECQLSGSGRLASSPAPSTRATTRNNRAKRASTVGYRGEMGAPQSRQRPRNTK